MGGRFRAAGQRGHRTSFMEQPVPQKRQNGAASDGQLRNRRSIGQIGLCERGAGRQYGGVGNNIGELERPALR